MKELVQINLQPVVDKTEILTKQNQQDMKALVDYVNENYYYDAELLKLLASFLDSCQDVHKMILTYLSGSQVNNNIMMDKVAEHGKDLDAFMDKWHPDV